jgi:hypothetical protein
MPYGLDNMAIIPTAKSLKKKKKTSGKRLSNSETAENAANIYTRADGNALIFEFATHVIRRKALCIVKTQMV